MLACLRHHAIVGGDHQHCTVDAAHAGEHVAYETLMPRDVDEAECRSRRGLHVRKAYVDGNAARFFLRQAVGIHLGQRFDKRGLAMVDVACGGDDHDARPLASTAANVRVTARELPKQGTYTECVPGPPATIRPMSPARRAIGSRVSGPMSPSSALRDCTARAKSRFAKIGR